MKVEYHGKTCSMVIFNADFPEDIPELLEAAAAYIRERRPIVVHAISVEYGIDVVGPSLYLIVEGE